MIISLTGTPGTGKTTVSEQLEGFEVIDLTRFVKEHGLGEQEDEFEVDIEAMVEKLNEKVDSSDDIVIEGHLSHHFPADYCVVLRCDPEELEARLSERNYSREKIQENVDSEMLDVILSEAVQDQENIIEIDTTDREASEVGEEIERKIEKDDEGYGDVDWMTGKESG